jgi:hypothetical protein
MSPSYISTVLEASVKFFFLLLMYKKGNVNTVEINEIGT